QRVGSRGRDARDRRARRTAGASNGGTSARVAEFGTRNARNRVAAMKLKLSSVRPPRGVDDARAAVDAVIAEMGDFDLRITGADTGMRSDAGAQGYLDLHRHEYVRTVRDVLDHRP